MLIKAFQTLRSITLMISFMAKCRLHPSKIGSQRRVHHGSKTQNFLTFYKSLKREPWRIHTATVVRDD